MMVNTQRPARTFKQPGRCSDPVYFTYVKYCKKIKYLSVRFIFNHFCFRKKLKSRIERFKVNTDLKRRIGLPQVPRKGHAPGDAVAVGINMSGYANRFYVICQNVIDFLHVHLSGAELNFPPKNDRQSSCPVPGKCSACIVIILPVPDGHPHPF